MLHINYKFEISIIGLCNIYKKIYVIFVFKLRK
jgi:hypothetical protein